MKKRYIHVLTLVLAAALLLSGCGGPFAQVYQRGKELWQTLEAGGLPASSEPLSQMTYSRPDMQVLEDTLLESCRIAREANSSEKVMDAVYDFYDVYDRFYTDLALADIHYSCDLTDTYWQAEYEFCLEQAATADAALEELYYALADSPVRQQLETDFFGEGYFESYDDESIWDEAFLALLEQEAQLQSRYQQIMTGDIYSEDFLEENTLPLAQLLVELVALRQQIAQQAGYDSYPDFAYDFYHARDYTAQQARTYMQAIPQVLGELYRAVNESQVWELSYGYCAEADTYAYVQTAAENMGGQIAKGFSILDRGSLCHISYGANKAAGAYEVYLWSYRSPFIYMSPYLEQSDKLFFSHEFGHFLNDYVCGGSYAGTDIAEVHSQAFEYLSLLYAEDTAQLEKYKLADSLCTYVEQAAYALFEQQLYDLEGEALTVDAVMALYERIGLEFGFDSWNWDSRDFVQISHFYLNPMYIISYAVSNDAAMQIYQMEKASAGAGLAVYEACLESQDSYLLRFAEEYGLESPFASGRLEQVRQTLEEGLADYL